MDTQDISDRLTRAIKLVNELYEELEYVARELKEDHKEHSKTIKHFHLAWLYDGVENMNDDLEKILEKIKNQEFNYHMQELNKLEMNAAIIETSERKFASKRSVAIKLIVNKEKFFRGKEILKITVIPNKKTWANFFEEILKISGL